MALDGVATILIANAKEQRAVELDDAVVCGVGF